VILVFLNTKVDILFSKPTERSENIFDRIFVIHCLLVGEHDKKKILAICQKIEDDISTDSQVYYSGDLRYFDDIRHYSISSTTDPVCCVEPATASDLSTIVRK